MTFIMRTDKLKNINEFEDKSLLIVDDDNPFRERLARAMEKKGFKVSQAEGVKKGLDQKLAYYFLLHLDLFLHLQLVKP